MNHKSKERLVQIVQDLDGDSDDPVYQESYDDIKDHTYQQLMERFGLEQNEGFNLNRIIIEKTEPDGNVYHFKSEQAVPFLEMVQEAIHQGFDGWDEYDQIVIRAFLADIAYAMTLTNDM